MTSDTESLPVSILMQDPSREILQSFFFPTERAWENSIFSGDFLMAEVKKQKLALLFHSLVTVNSSLKNSLSQDHLIWLKHNYYTALEKVTLQQEAIKELLHTFQENNLPVILLRGQSLGLFYYPDAALRPAWDVDILIHPQDLARCGDICSQLGLVRREAHGEIGFFRNSGIQFHLDVHTDLWYESQENTLWERCLQKDFLGQPCLILGPEDHVIHIVAHSVMHHGRFSLHDAVDLALIIRKEEHLDWTQIHRTVRGTHLSAVIYYALNKISAWTSIKIPDALLSPFKPTGASAWQIPFYERIIRSYDRPFVGHFLRPFCIQGWRGKKNFVLNYLFPSSEFIRQRYSAPHMFSVAWWRFVRPLTLCYKSLGFLVRCLLQ